MRQSVRKSVLQKAICRVEWQPHELSKQISLVRFSAQTVNVATNLAIRSTCFVDDETSFSRADRTTAAASRTSCESTGNLNFLRLQLAKSFGELDSFCATSLADELNRKREEVCFKFSGGIAILKTRS